jgi:gliding-associated putative ABC transporter substrate-binding component GldG
MNGGKIIWCIDKLHAELDSLMRTKGEYTAFDRNLNIDELLFKYGVRINGDLLQDLLCSKIPLVIGRNPDGSPKMQRMPWPYYPLLSANNNNPISRNLDKVLPVFPSSIDTVAAKGIKKTILLSTDTNSRSLSTPALVSVNSVKTAEDFNSFTKSFVPVAVLLEGHFSSLYANRISLADKDSVLAQSGKPYLASAAVAGKQIVMSDADIVTNAVSPTNGPLEMGVLPFENYRFANREFFLNSIDYLVSKNAVFESRNKDFKLRLLNKELVATERNKWQLINVLLPVLLMVLVGIFFNWQRKQKYCK